MTRLPRPVPLTLGVIATFVLLSAVMTRDPVRDAATLEKVGEVSLQRPLGYVLLAPLSNVLDAITLFSVRQHVALGVTLILCYAIWWWFVGRAALRAITPGRRWLREFARIGVGLVILVAVYAAAVVMPRPMARLVTSSDIVVIDFHAHTKYSHDGRPDWTPEDVRHWHSAAGFNIAYISDHRTFEGARLGWSNNPRMAADATLLIPAIEVGWRGEHINVLDADRMYRGLLTDNLRDIDEKALAIASSLPNNEPILIETIPGKPENMIAASGRGTGGVRAMELIDGSPRGLGQFRQQRARLVKIADSLNLALVAGSDNHGWGHTAAGWTLMFIPGWRGVAAGELSVVTSTLLRAGGNQSTRVVERYLPSTESGVALPLTVPLVAWGMLRTLSVEERAAWLVWLAIFYLLWRVRDARSAQREARV